jgi:hypothetical protein
MAAFRVLALMAATVACGLDPLRLSERRLSDHVSLRKFLGDEYYLVTDRTRAQGALLAGSVLRVARRDSVLLVQRVLHKTTEWVAIDPITGTVSEPLDVAARRARSSGAIPPSVRVDSVWAQLPW